MRSAKLHEIFLGELWWANLLWLIYGYYMVNDLESYGLSMIIWLVVFRHPSEKWLNIKLGWWHSQYIRENKIHVPVTTNQDFFYFMGLVDYPLIFGWVAINHLDSMGFFMDFIRDTVYIQPTIVSSSHSRMVYTTHCHISDGLRQPKSLKLVARNRPKGSCSQQTRTGHQAPLPSTYVWHVSRYSSSIFP